MKLRKYDYGLAVMRLQPLHFGHIALIDRMIKECNHPIIAIGSAQESRTWGNPFTYSERKHMVYNYYGSRLADGMVIPIQDIFNLGKWARYALDEAERRIKNKISVYYCGADQDAGLFMNEGIKAVVTDRDSGMYRGMSGSKIRGMIVSGSSDWKTMVPAMNHPIIQKVYGSVAK